MLSTPDLHLGLLACSLELVSAAVLEVRAWKWQPGVVLEVRVWVVVAGERCGAGGMCVCVCTRGGEDVALSRTTEPLFPYFVAVSFF